jgi:hypothetical protein
MNFLDLLNRSIYTIMISFDFKKDKSDYKKTSFNFHFDDFFDLLF